MHVVDCRSSSESRRSCSSSSIRTSIIRTSIVVIVGVVVGRVVVAIVVIEIELVVTGIINRRIHVERGKKRERQKKGDREH